MTRFFDFFLLLLAGMLTAYSNTPHRTAFEADTTIELTATMVSPIDIKLEWRDPATSPAGHIVEYTNDLKDEFIILGFCPPQQTSFIHPRLMPDTTFYYRVRAFYGPAASPIEVSLPEYLTDSAYAAAYARPEDYEWAAPVIIPDSVNVAKKSIRSAASMIDAVPTGLKASLIHTTVSGFKLTWTDHASDEEGFLLEKIRQNSEEFIVCAVVEPNINSFGWAFEPPERKGSFRIRAFYFGKPSPIVKKNTGEDPAHNVIPGMR